MAAGTVITPQFSVNPGFGVQIILPDHQSSCPQNGAKDKTTELTSPGRGVAGNIKFHVSPKPMAPQGKARVPEGIVGRGPGWDVPGAVEKAFDFILPTVEALEVLISV